MNRPLAASDSGFTLIEVLVALTILSISLVVLLHVFSDSLNRSRESAAEMAANSLAQSLLADAGSGIPLQPGDTNGQAPNGFFWRLHVEPYGSDDDRKAWPLGALSVSASVGWRDGERRKWVTLTTLRAVPKETEK